MWVVCHVDPFGFPFARYGTDQSQRRAAVGKLFGFAPGSIVSKPAFQDDLEVLPGARTSTSNGRCEDLNEPPSVDCSFFDDILVRLLGRTSLVFT